MRWSVIGKRLLPLTEGQRVKGLEFAQVFLPGRSADQIPLPGCSPAVGTNSSGSCLSSRNAHFCRWW